MRLRDYALMIAQEKLFFTWMFVPETHSLRVFTTLKDEKHTVIDVRDVPEDDEDMKEYMMKYMERCHDEISRTEDND